MRWTKSGQPDLSFDGMACLDPVSATIAAVGDFFASAGAATAGAIGASDAVGAAIGTGLEGATIGGLGGSAVSAITGRPILPGLAAGALTGGAIGGLGPALGSTLGIGTTAGDVLAGAGAGALGGAVIPGAGGAGAGALSGSLSGAVAGLTSGSTGGTGGGATPTTGTGAGASAAGTAAPSSIGSFDTVGLPTTAASDLGSPGVAGSSVSTPPSPSSGSVSAPSDQITLASTSDTVSPASGGTQSSPELFPLPPVPPALDASGSPIFTASGAPAYPSLAAAQAAGIADTANLAGGVVPQQSGVPGILQSLGLNGPAAGTLGNATPGSGPDGTFTASDAASASASGGGSAASGDVGGLLSKYAGPAVAGTAILADLLKGTTPLPNQNALASEANTLASQGNQLQSYLATGTLPPGVQQSITQATEQAKAAIRSRYAQSGGNTSAMAQDLANVDQVAATQGAKIATQLLSQGVSETGLATNIYSNLLNQAITQNNQLGSAFGNLATALAGTPTILKIGQAA